MISYEGLCLQLKKKGITKTDLTREIGISSRTIAKIAKGETKYLSIMRFVAIGIASVATLMAVVSLLVSFYSKTPTTEVEDAIDSLNDLYKYWSK